MISPTLYGREFMLKMVRSDVMMCGGTVADNKTILGRHAIRGREARVGKGRSAWDMRKVM